MLLTFASEKWTKAPYAELAEYTITEKARFPYHAGPLTTITSKLVGNVLRIVAE